MNWHYVENGQQAGPVTEEQLVQLLQSGKITADTLVWREGMADWAPYQQAGIQTGAPPVLQPTALRIKDSARPGEGICAECGQYFPSDELITLNKTLVCARCKPLFLQRLAEGVATGGAAGLWREGKKLVTRSETPFPDRCVKCNAPANGFRLKRVLYWHNPAFFLLILCNVVIYVIVAMFVRKKAVLHIGLCEPHRKQRQIAVIASSIGILGGLGMLIGGGAAQNGWVALAGAIFFVTGLIWSIAKARTITPTKIDKDGTVWATGASREFLDQLPER